jgi:hypothetical protein
MASGRVNGDGEPAIPRRHGHHSQQFDGQLSLPAPQAHPHHSGAAVTRRDRNLALDHI